MANSDGTPPQSGRAFGQEPDQARSLHDLNNLLGAVVGSLQLIGLRHKDDAKTQTIVANAQTSMGDLREFIKTALRRSVDEKSPAGLSARVDVLGGHASITDGADRHDLFFAAIEMTRMPMIVTDPNQPDNPVVFCNQAFLNTTGYDMDEVIGRNCRFLQGPGTDKDKVAQVRRAIEQRTDIAVEVQNYRKDGSMFWNALFVSPIFDRDGKLLYYFGSQLDITRRREAETALRRAQKMEALGQLTGGIAHDFNNLLQVIIGNVQLAKTVSDNPEKLARHHDFVMQSAQKAKTLTQQLLAFSRQQPLETRVVNFRRVIADLKDLLSKTLGPNIDIHLNLPDDLDNAEIDVIQLEMALINILANARDAMPQGGAVDISACNVGVYAGDPRGLRQGRYIELTIRDTGHGMSPEVLAHITEPFFTTKEVGKGTGLGLAQVYGFVKQSDGGFTVDSEEGKGTTIRLTFPASQSDVSAKKASEKDVRLTGNGERILVVEDNREVRELACAILEHEGYVVREAETARHALQIFHEDPSAVDMLFTDIIMPGQMNGVALAKELRKAKSDMAILITTGFAEDVHGHTNSSEFETIYKPYLPEELSEKVRGVLNRKLNHRS